METEVKNRKKNKTSQHKKKDLVNGEKSGKLELTPRDEVSNISQPQCQLR